MMQLTAITGPYWPEPVGVLSVEHVDGFTTIEACGLHTGRHYSTTLPQEDWKAIAPTREQVPAFDAPPVEFRLALEAERLRLAHACDPLLATNNSLVDLLPHQMEAVYKVMLPQPTIRHLMAHDAGAGKTVMCGLLHKELRMRTPSLRTLIVAPAALVVQWQRELREKFLEDFQVIDRERLNAAGNVWAETQQAITSVSFASQRDVRASLANVHWDLVIVDEAHHMAAYTTHSTQAYRLGTILSRQCRHLVLASATPHKGDPDNFLKLLQLLDPAIHDPGIVQRGADGQRGNPLMLRRLKEEMVDFCGEPLFKRREVETYLHAITENPPELALYTALTEYVNKTYRAAEKIGGQVKVNVKFAMAMLQRRMNSSFYALEQSLARRRDALAKQQVVAAVAPTEGYVEDAPEQERWEVEAQRETASPARTRKEREREISEIDGLMVHIQMVRDTAYETKLAKLQDIMRDAGVEPGNGERLLVFTEFKDTLTFLRSRFEEWGYAVTQIDGTMPHDLRRRAEKDFATKCQVMVATEAAGEGINLQFCARMVNYDIPWVPTRLEQRMGRIHRYGQKRVARIYNLVAADTREGYVLRGLLERLQTMRTHLGDQVFDVVSTLVADADVEELLNEVALSPETEASQYEALQAILTATEAGEERWRQWEEHPHPLDPQEFEPLRQASKQFRLTPEYAQHFFVDVLRALNETPEAESDGADPGDAECITLQVRRPSVAQRLGLPRDTRLRFTFVRDHSGNAPPPCYIALGSELLDRALATARAEWSHLLDQGASFMDRSLAPGDAYLLWFVRAVVVDGLGRPVAGRLFAARQTATEIVPASASALIDLVPCTGETAQVPPSLRALTRDPGVVLEWSIEKQQLPFLFDSREARKQIVTQRKRAMLDDAREAASAAVSRYNNAVFGDEPDQDEAEEAWQLAEARVRELEVRFQQEGSCALGRPEVVGVAAVVPMAGPPEHDMPDRRHDIEATAQALVCAYEERHGRSVRDVTGENVQHPYDLHSTGPGGPRCIEVKGTESGNVFLSETQRRTAKRLGDSYYLYIVLNPLHDPRLTIIRNPLARMRYDSILYGGVEYQFRKSTWQSAGDEEVDL